MSKGTESMLMKRCDILKEALELLLKEKDHAEIYLRNHGMSESFLRMSTLGEWRAMIIKIALQRSRQVINEQEPKYFFLSYRALNRMLTFANSFKLRRRN